VSSVSDANAFEAMIDRAAIASGYDPQSGYARAHLGTNKFAGTRRTGAYETASTSLNAGEAIERIAVGLRGTAGLNTLILATLSE